ncbi:RsmB/NOP family class I SAM-dependent RNA methyltransferase [Candidatus Woesearchaeota archaeon]|nr:RsmB/NOP family class I SAM-dependent RNA methyltransferase [Candidatus Woesearchaeota archaeon]
MVEQIPKTENIVIKPGFEARYKTLCGANYEEFMKYSLSFLRRSIRVNTLKTSVLKTKKSLEKKGWILTSIPWCKEGFWIEHETGRRDIGNTAEHALGFIYVQEAVSMIPPIVLNPKPGELVLDMCAAPGSKTSQMAMYMNNDGLIVANDYQGMRARPLGINMQRVGATNTLISLSEGQRLRVGGFDKILVDAPCSGTGTIRKSLKTLRMWNENMIRRLAGTQKQLILHAYKMLRPGGELVYSTCTLEPEEDEAIINYLLEKHPDADVVPFDLDIKRAEPVLEWDGQKFDPRIKNVLRLYPQLNNTEGFFVAKIKKQK